MDTKCLWMIGVTALSSLEGGHMTASLSDFFVKHRQIVICLKHINAPIAVPNKNKKILS